ncbi:MAG: OsmC family peroxiredoxin, partial [Gammaproteobacteria bacterium]
MTTSVTTTLNDVNMDAVAGLAGKIQQEPEVADTKWSARVDWKGGFRSEATVRDFEPMKS